MTIDWVTDAVTRVTPQMVATRRHLHQHPELSFEERETAAFIHHQLSAFGLQPVMLLDGTAVTAEFGTGNGATLAV
jgi:metal-dependent amidase/aminoacylase/carboxypeptidase family protein